MKMQKKMKQKKPQMVPFDRKSDMKSPLEKRRVYNPSFLVSKKKHAKSRRPGQMTGPLL